jgi:hypothetical protein
VRVLREHGGRRAPAASWIGPEDYVDKAALPRILELIEESSRQDVEKAAEWKREVELQELLIDTISSSDDL